jgi:hypothetical protein
MRRFGLGVTRAVLFVWMPAALPAWRGPMQEAPAVDFPTPQCTGCTVESSHLVLGSVR